MHYTAMAAVSYMPMTTPPDLTFALDISALGNAAIIAITVVIVASVFLARWWSDNSARKATVIQAQRSPAVR